MRQNASIGVKIVFKTIVCIAFMLHVDMLKAVNCSFLKAVVLSYNCNGVCIEIE